MSIEKFECPEWFDLQNYDDSNQLSPSEWVFHLGMRSFILQNETTDVSISLFNRLIHNSLKTPFYKNVFTHDLYRGNYYNIQYKDMKIIKWKKLGEYHAMGFIYKNQYHNPYHNEPIKLIQEIQQSKINKGLINETVKVFSITDLFNQANSLKSEYLDSFEQSEKILNSNQMTLNDQEKTAITKANKLLHLGDMLKYAVVELDLSAPSSVIKKDFNRLLKALKKNDDLLLQLNTLTFDSWNRTLKPKMIDARILPYLDLYIYNKMNKIDYTNEQYDEILFGVNLNYDKKRRITHPLAMKMIKTKELRALSSFCRKSPSIK